MELEIKIKNGKLLVYEVNSEYRNYLEKFEKKYHKKIIENFMEYL